MIHAVTLKDLAGHYNTLLAAHCGKDFKKRLLSRTEIDDSAVEHQYVVTVFRHGITREVKFGRNFSRAMAFYNKLEE